jgi:outer membrane protein insertion porin family
LAVEKKALTKTQKASVKTISNSVVQKISKIEVLGLKKIEKEAVLQKISSAVGKNFDREQVSKDIQTLFRMNFFVQVEVEKEASSDGVVLTFNMVEKPTVSEIEFIGNAEIKSEDLETQSGLKAFEVVNFSKIQAAVQKIEKHYEDKGFYLVKVESSIEEVQANEAVKIKFNITENEKVKVKKVTFIGNRQIKDSELKNDPRMFTKEAGFFSFHQ